MLPDKHVHSSPPDSVGQGYPDRVSPQSEMVSVVSFSPDHALCRLRTFCSGRNQQDLPLKLDLLHGDSLCETPLPAQTLAGEGDRLTAFLSGAARARLEGITAALSSPLPDLDETALVFVSADEMAAWLLPLPPVGQGAELSTPQLCKILIEHGVVHGIDWGLLRRLSACPQRYFQLFLIARGTPPTPGQDGRVIDRYPRFRSEDVQVEELGQADYISLKLVQEIQKNDIICEIVPPTPGTPGSTVTGKALSAPGGQAAVVPQGRNTRLTEDGQYLIAEREGHLAFSGRDFQVRPVLHLYESDMPSSQRIKFLGDIHIHCDLDRGGFICAVGTVQIDGAVEGCTIEAGESIIVSSGVQGQDQAVLHAQKSVYAKYLEHCTVYARESVQADCIISCKIYSNGTVRVRTGRGAIVGGTIHAAREVSAVSVGSKAERPTSVILGGHPCEDAERTQVREEIRSIERSISDLERHSRDPDAPQKLSKLHLNLCVAKMKLEKFDKELESQPSDPFCRDMRRLLCDTAYPGTTVSIDHGAFRFVQVEHGCAIGVADGLVGRL